MVCLSFILSSGRRELLQPSFLELVQSIPKRGFSLWVNCQKSSSLSSFSKLSTRAFQAYNQVHLFESTRQHRFLSLVNIQRSLSRSFVTGPTSFAFTLQRGSCCPSPLQVPRNRPIYQPRRNMSLKSFYAEWTAPKPEPTRLSTQWWIVWTIRFIVFAITGSSSVRFVRPLMKTYLGIDGSWAEGPPSFYIASFAFVTPIYTVILLTLGTISGQQQYFLKIASRMWSRILPFLFKKANPKVPKKSS
eukprot:m.53454 g.53454  ORF g.53454 m.53454 type:complete len:246 (-) comp7667_c0_seq1:146-883(-)